MSSYQVIARKWRPGLFEEIVGQAHVTRTLKNALISGRTAHAYIFAGPRGVGKTTAARILAKSLNCVNGPTPNPCNECDSCKSIKSGSAVDVSEIDGASNNSVDSVRELTENVRYLPAQARYRIYIIDEVHMLSNQAFNALLKTLEEPPPHVVFIFATTEAHKIPLTILSRCQRFDFKRIPFRDIQQHLKKIVIDEGIKFEDEALFTLAREADGSLRDSQSLLEQVVSFSGENITQADVAEALGIMDRGILNDLADALISKDGRACLNIVEKIYDFGYDLKRACADLLERIRDITVVKVTGDNTLLDLPDSDLERLKTLAAKTGPERLQTLFGIVSKGYEEISRSSNPRYSFEIALLRGAHFDEVRSVESLIARLETLRLKVDSASPMRGVGVADAGRNAEPLSSGRSSAVSDVARTAESSTPYSAPSAVKTPQAVRKTAPVTAIPPVPEAPEVGKPANEVVKAKDISSYISSKVPSLAGELANATVEVDGDDVNIKVASAKQSFFMIKRQHIEDICLEFFGRRMRVNVLGMEDAGEDKKKDSDPLLKDALRILGGRVIEDRRRTNV